MIGTRSDGPPTLPGPEDLMALYLPSAGVSCPAHHIKFRFVCVRAAAGHSFPRFHIRLIQVDTTVAGELQPSTFNLLTPVTGLYGTDCDGEFFGQCIRLGM
eukprot:gene9803-biopygen2861